MSARVMRDFRRQARKVANDTVLAVAPGISAAISNEKLTRDRVDAIETVLRDVAKHATMASVVLTRPLWGRLKWLLVGR